MGYTNSLYCSTQKFVLWSFSLVTLDGSLCNQSSHQFELDWKPVTNLDWNGKEISSLMAISRTILTDIQGCEAPGKYSDEISPLADCLKDLCTKIELLVPWKKSLLRQIYGYFFMYCIVFIYLFIHGKSSVQIC